LAWGFPKGSPYTELISHQLNRFKETGLMKKMMKKQVEFICKDYVTQLLPSTFCFLLAKLVILKKKSGDCVFSKMSIMQTKLDTSLCMYNLALWKTYFVMASDHIKMFLAISYFGNLLRFQG
jgi:hypothetical protein